MVAEDDVDLDTLQAQIDMSVSFAQTLVASWMKPTRLAHFGSSVVNATQILEEELRRPPRLGVGASISTAAPLAHEASKLKRRLEKNGTKGEGTVILQSQDPKSDDEERKGRPVKRKTKVDPFGHEGSKKKRRANSVHNPFSVENAPKRSLQDNSTLREPTEHNPSSGKEKQGTGPGDQQIHVTEGQRSAPARLPIRTTFSPSLTAPAVTPLSASSRAISAPDPGNINKPETIQLHNSMPMPDKARPLGIPLLNLDGPPELTVQPGNASGLSNPRRKRKRRRRKKTLITGGDNDNSH